MHKQERVMTELRSESEKTVCLFNQHPPIDIASSKQVGEIPEAWSPLHLLCSAVESCFALTLRALADKMRIDVVSYSSTAEAVFDTKDDKHTELVALTIRPTIHLAHDEDRTKLPLLYRKSEEYCYVARSLHITVAVES